MAVFETAIQLADERLRKTYLDFTYRDCPEGRAKMEALLRAELESQPFFHDASFARSEVAGELLASNQGKVAAALAQLEVLDGHPVALGGRYQIIRHIGKGSGGLVYLAEQHQPVCRRVAIKVLRFGMDSPQAIATFEREGQALALMNHPHIAQIFDAGASESGLPYFVMELVEGEKITDFCDARHFSIRRRLELFIEVCGAIQHAHQKGIIHRDIKPSNVLVVMTDNQPIPKVIDFGIAKATAEGISGHGVDIRAEPFIGTPAYMSPEQTENGGEDVDTRSDVYALGVLLYELLAGATPHNPQLLMRDGVSGLARALRENLALPPSERVAMLDHCSLVRLVSGRKTAKRRLLKSLRGDLDAIVMKALSVDRQARYATVNNLATDLRRHLDWIPVMAREPGNLYSFGRFMRRNRLAVFSVTSVAAALLLGSAVSFWTYLRELDAREKAAFVRTSEAVLRQQAEAREIVAKVSILLNDGKIDEADSLLQEIPLATIQPSLEAANVFRFLGDRNAMLGRWKKATECYVKLMEANRLESPEKTAPGLDLLTLALLEEGNTEGYERIRREMLGRFPAPSDVIAAEHMVRMSLFLPADDAILSHLEPIAAILAESVKRRTPMSDKEKHFMAWNALTLALFEYRRGDIVACKQMVELSRSLDSLLPARNASGKALAAMAMHRLGKQEGAVAELAAARKITDEHASRIHLNIGDLPGNDSSSWNSWAFARILIREAEALFLAK